MQGDQQDIVHRLKQVLPLAWFPDDSPVLDIVLGGIAWAWSWVYSLLQDVKAQTRISTATQSWLDLISYDYFGARMARRVNENDAEYRARIQLELIRERGTRQAVIASLVDTTGRIPTVFEPANTRDTGGYGNSTAAGSGLAYGVAGGWGSLCLPMQCFITAYRPLGVGIASASGWCGGGGGYGQGALEYGNLDMMQGQVTDSDIYRVLAESLPVGVIAWTRISS